MCACNSALSFDISVEKSHPRSGQKILLSEKTAVQLILVEYSVSASFSLNPNFFIVSRNVFGKDFLVVFFPSCPALQTVFRLVISWWDTGNLSVHLRQGCRIEFFEAFFRPKSCHSNLVIIFIVDHEWPNGFQH